MGDGNFGRRGRLFASLALAAALAACGYHDGYNYPCAPGDIGCGTGPGLVYTSGIVATDLNGDGKADLAVTRTLNLATPGDVLVYLHSASGSGGLLPPVIYPNDAGFGWIGSADLNHDGLPDLVTANPASGVIALYFNDAQQKGTFSLPQFLSAPGVSQVAVLDMNGDGFGDIVAADFQVSLFLQNPSAPGTFHAPIALYSGGANWVVLGDLNGDGFPDIALVDQVGVKVLFHTGVASSTTYSAPVSVFTQTPVFGLFGGNMVAIADVNGDGLNDLIITDPGPPGVNPTVSVLLQDPANHGQFLAPPVSYSIQGGDPGATIIVRDVNGDGHPDIVVGGNFAISVLLADPSKPGAFLAPANYNVPEPALDIAVADINGDGFPDIVTTTSASGLQSGESTTPLGVLYQDAAHPGTFLPLQDL